MAVSKFAGFQADTSALVPTKSLTANREKREPRFFQEGIHTVTIASVQEKGLVSTLGEGDSPWETLNMKLEGTGGKSTYTNLLVPLKDLVFKGETNSYPARSFVDFVKALGYETGSSNLVAVLTKHFQDPQSLVGMELQVQAGYTGNHLVPKDGKLHLVMKYGKPVLKDGEPAVFNERAEAEEWAQSAGVKLQKFPEIVAFLPAEKLKAIATPVKKAESSKSAAF